MNSNDITVTDARVLNSFSKVNNLIFNGETEKQIKEAVNEAKLKTGIVKKYYMDLNKVEVTLNDGGGTVLCRVLQLLCAEFITKYTPEGSYDYDETIGAGYVIPRGEIECVVLPTSDNEKHADYFVIGYYSSKNTPDPVPAPTQGNIKLSYIGAVDEFLVQFGFNGFNVISNNINQYVGYNSNYTKPIDELASKQTLNKEYYTKTEVDKLLDDLKKELKEEKT
ncbi:hypothetical protein [uncultured Methanobrevibacter sp.]|uniref:hypothetical protein n=1 Tax=uncultured Methanobrevibacter sp. TaxID=253161 RepID=UPI00262AEEF1|nr:hypothetical protein [uncultured Methanobrevibacter sp.]